LKQRFNEAEVTTFNDKGFNSKLCASISSGKVIIIENIGEELEPTMDPVLSRAITVKNRKFFIKMGEAEIE